MYHRVIPRDLFNESKLLKCLGQLALIIHDGKDAKGAKPRNLRIYHDGEPFEIDQDPMDGGLYAQNFCVMHDGEELEELMLTSDYNSKDPYPLRLYANDGNWRVFNDDGSMSDDFLAYLNSQCRR